VRARKLRNADKRPTERGRRALSGGTVRASCMPSRQRAFGTPRVDAGGNSPPIGRAPLPFGKRKAPVGLSNRPGRFKSGLELAKASTPRR